jgi:hypothetical protein
MEREMINARLSELRVSVMPILEYSQRELRDYTIHGHMHSENVEKLLTDIILRCNMQGGDCSINPTEEYILICSAWLHDIGNILGRDNHNNKTCEIIDHLIPTEIAGVDRDHIESIKWICYSHPREVSIYGVPLETRYRSTVVRLRYLTAIFRIADAGDISSRRAPRGVYKIIKGKLTRKSDRIWRSYQAVRDVSFLPTENSIIMTATDKRKARPAASEFQAEFDEVEPILRRYHFPYINVLIVRENIAPYRGRIMLSELGGE